MSTTPTRQDYQITVNIYDATPDEADAVREELAGSIEDARDSGIWHEPVSVDCGEPEPLRTRS